MAEKVDYVALKKGGFMRQKQKGCFSLRLAVVGGNLTAENIKTVAEVAEKYADYPLIHISVFNRYHLFLGKAIQRCYSQKSSDR